MQDYVKTHVVSILQKCGWTPAIGDDSLNHWQQNGFYIQLNGYNPVAGGHKLADDLRVTNSHLEIFRMTVEQMQEQPYLSFIKNPSN